MSDFSIEEQILALKNEKIKLEDKWQGECAKQYMKAIDTYINCAKKIEESLNNINKKMKSVAAVIEGNDETDDSIKGPLVYKNF